MFTRSVLGNGLITRVPLRSISSVSNLCPVNHDISSNLNLPRRSQIVQVRTASNVTSKFIKILKFFRRKSGEQNRLSDGLDESYKMVYRGDTNTYLQCLLGTVQFTAVAGTGGVIASTAGLTDTSDLLPLHEMIGFSLVYVLIVYCTFYFAKAYPLRMYYSESKNKFCIVRFNNNPITIRKLEVAPGEAKHLPKSYLSQNILPYYQDMCMIAGKHKILLIESNFIMPKYYNMLLGY